MLDHSASVFYKGAFITSSSETNSLREAERTMVIVSKWEFERSWSKFMKVQLFTVNCF